MKYDIFCHKDLKFRAISVEDETVYTLKFRQKIHPLDISVEKHNWSADKHANLPKPFTCKTEHNLMFEC